VLCRSNAEAVDRLMRHHEADVPAAIVGGGNDMRRLAEAAIDLQTKGRTSHPELCAFTSWSMVQEYVENDHGGRDLTVAVKLIDDHGPEEIIGAIERSVSETKAAIVLSTAHKAKGREWDTVQIANDFYKPGPDEDGRQVEPAREESMLAYVAVTRAKQCLDRSGLEWIDDYAGSSGSMHARLARSISRRSR
jgi:UvrD-like helicase C-terminal domain